MAKQDVTYNFRAQMEDFLRGLGKGKAGLSDLTKESEKLELSADEVREKMAGLTKEIGGMKDMDAIRQKQAELKNLGQELDRINGKQKEFAKAPAGGGGGAGGVGAGAFFGSMAGNLAAAGMSVLAGGVKDVASAMIGGNAEMEVYEKQFKTLLGSTTGAKQRLAELAKFGAETPFELPEIAAAEKVLLGFGLTGQKVIDLTGKNASGFRTLVGDIAAGTGASFEEIALNMGKLSSGATGEAISRFQEMGIATREQLTQMGVQFSKSGELLSPLPKAMQAITELTQKKFGGGMKELSSTMEGLGSTAKDVLGEIGRDIGKPIFDAAKQGLVGVLEWMQSPKVQETLQNVADGIEEISSLFDSQGQAMQRLARQQREGIQNAIDYNDKKIDELENVQTLAGEYETYAGKTKLSADEQARLDEITAQINTTYPGLITNTDTYNTSLEKLRSKSNEAATAVGRLKTQNEGLSKALAQSAINEERGKVRESFEGLIDAVDEYRDRLGETEAASVTAALRGTQFAGAAAGIMKLLGDDRDVAHNFARELLYSEDAFNKFSQSYIDLSDQSKGQSPFLPYMSQVIDFVAKVKEGKATVQDLQQQMKNGPAPPPAEDTGTGGTPTDPLKFISGSITDLQEKLGKLQEQQKSFTRAGSAEYDQLGKKIAEAAEELERLSAAGEQLSEADRFGRVFDDLKDGLDEYMVDVDKFNENAVTGPGGEQEKNDKIRQLEIEAIENRKRALMEDYYFKLDLIDRETGDEREKNLKKVALQRKLHKDLKTERERDAANKRQLEDEAEKAAQSHRGAIDGIFADLQTAAGEQNVIFKVGAVGRATINTYEAATAAYKSAAAIPGVGWIAGPVAAGAAVAAGIANVQKILGVRLMAEGGIITKPTFAIAGEAGPEGFLPRKTLIKDIGEAMQIAFGGMQKQRTGKSVLSKRDNINVNIGVSPFVRGVRAARGREQRGVF